MYSLPVVLVGIDQDELSSVRRELNHSNAEIECELSSVGAAIERLRQTRKKLRLFIIKADLDHGAQNVQLLSDYFPNWPILALVPGTANVPQFLDINRSGAQQIVPLPLDPLDFQYALKQIGARTGQTQPDRLVLAVAGAVGGSGVTTLAINLAAELAERFSRTAILAELTLQVGTMASMLDAQPRVTLLDLLKEIHRVDDLLVERALVPISAGFKFLAGPGEVCSPRLIDPGHLTKIVSYLKRLADVTILDVPSAFNDAESELLHSADHLVLIGLQNVPSIRTLKLFCSALPKDRIEHSLWVVVNRYDPDLKGFGLSEIKQMLGIPRVLTMANDFRAVSRSINQGRPLRKVVPDTPILRDIDVLIHSLLGLEQQHKLKQKGLFSRVFGNGKA
jgi:pilus assembly protein CpaE